MSNTITDASNSLLEHAAHSADVAIHGTQRLANQAMDGVSHSMQVASKQVRESANLASDKTITYIRDEPVKAMLIAAATGAALVALARLIGRPNSAY